MLKEPVCSLLCNRPVQILARNGLPRSIEFYLVHSQKRPRGTSVIDVGGVEMLASSPAHIDISNASEPSRSAPSTSQQIKITRSFVALDKPEQDLTSVEDDPLPAVARV